MNAHTKALGAGSDTARDPLAAAKRVDEHFAVRPKAQPAQAIAAEYDRKALANNAVLYAIRQRGEGLFTAFAVQCAEQIAKTLDIIALGEVATETVPEASELPAEDTYSDSLAKVGDALVELADAAQEKAA